MIHTIIVMRIQYGDSKVLRPVIPIKSLIIAKCNYYYYLTVKMDEVNQDVESFRMHIVKCF